MPGLSFNPEIEVEAQAENLKMSFLTNASIEVPITINAPPRIVRKVLLDFPRWPEWKKKQNLINHLHVKRPPSVRRSCYDDQEEVVVSGLEAKGGDMMHINSVQAGDAIATIYVRAYPVPGFTASDTYLPPLTSYLPNYRYRHRIPKRGSDRASSVDTRIR